jgi:Flp pilus assembly protein TadG
MKLSKKASSAAHALRSSESGAVAIIFVLALIPILGLVGAAIDYSRATATRARMQTALDAAVLSAAVVQGGDADRRSAFRTTFDSYDLGGDALAANATVDLSTPGVIKGRASGRINTSFARVMGINAVDLGVVSEGRVGGAAEIVMALDVSGSMQNGDMSGRTRIDVLKEAAGDLMDAAVAEARTASALKFGYVPFTMNVNIGTSNTAFVDGATDPMFAGTSWAGCVLERAPPNHLSNTYTPATKFRAYISPPETTESACINPGGGAMGVYKYVDTIPQYGGPNSGNTRGPNYNCNRHAMQPLTSDTAGLKAKIALLDSPPNMGTLLAPGVTWATRLLTPNAPFPGAAPLTSSTRKVLVVLTDGEQTTEWGSAGCAASQNTSGAAYRFDPASLGLGGRVIGPNGPRDYFGPYGYLFDSDPLGLRYTDYSQVDPRLDVLALDSCNFAKARGIEVYAVAVSSGAAPGTAVHDTLRSCATDPSHFFYAADAGALKAAFVAIGRNTARFVRTQ